MNFFETVIMIFATLVVIEFGVHIIYHAITGKAGLYDPPFQYLKDIFQQVQRATDRRHDYAQARKIIFNPNSSIIDSAYSLDYSDIYNFKMNEEGNLT